MTEKSEVTINLGAGLEHLDVSVSIAPYFTTVGAMTEALAGKDRGLPRQIKKAVLSAVTASVADALDPLSSPNSSMIPDCILPVTPRADVGTETYLEAMRSMSDEEIGADLAQEFGPEVPTYWQSPLRQPQRWLRSFADAAELVSKELEPVWERARPLIDRDVERIGLTLVRGGVEALLNSISPRIACRNGILSFDDVVPGSYNLSGRRIVLVPIVSGPRLLMSCFDNPDLIWIGYPISGVGQIATGPCPARPDAEDRLSLVLGASRAAVVRYLVRPSFMSEAARDLVIAPNTLTFHCDHLERAGLVIRERRGRQVEVSRTERADALIDLMDPL